MEVRKDSKHDGKRGEDSSREDNSEVELRQKSSQWGVVKRKGAVTVHMEDVHALTRRGHSPRSEVLKEERTL